MPHSDHLQLGEWNAVCSMCNGKFKSGDLRKHWQGMWRCQKCWEPRQPQDFVRAVPDNQAPPWVQPEVSTFINPRTQNPATPVVTAELNPEGGVIVTWTPVIFPFGTSPAPYYNVCVSQNGGAETCYGPFPPEQLFYLDETEYPPGTDLTYTVQATVVSNGVNFRSEGEAEVEVPLGDTLTITAGAVDAARGYMGNPDDPAYPMGSISNDLHVPGYKIYAALDTTSNTFWFEIAIEPSFGVAPSISSLTSIEINGNVLLRVNAVSSGTRTTPYTRWWQWLGRQDLLLGQTYPLIVTMA